MLCLCDERVRDSGERKVCNRTPAEELCCRILFLESTCDMKELADGHKAFFNQC